MTRNRLYGGIAVGVIAVVGVVVAVVLTRGSSGGGGTGSGPVQSAQAQALQKQLHADSCTDAGFALENSAGGSREAVFDCAFGDRRRCVAVGNGVACDATADVRRLFANASGGRRPACAGS